MAASPKRSAGVLLHRRRPTGIEVLIGHMGGPMWARKDDAGWSIPKGLYEPDEDALDAACREFAEELGCPVPVPADQLVPLGDLRTSSGKVLSIWTGEGDLDADRCVSNTFELEWPPRSGRLIEVPEIDRAAWFDLNTARVKLVKGQVPYLDRLEALLA